MRLKEFAHGFDLANIQRDCKKEALRFFPSGGTGVNAARETLRSRSPMPFIWRIQSVAANKE